MYFLRTVVRTQVLTKLFEPAYLIHSQPLFSLHEKHLGERPLCKSSVMLQFWQFGAPHQLGVENFISGLAFNDFSSLL